MVQDNFNKWFYIFEHAKLILCLINKIFKQKKYFKTLFFDMSKLDSWSCYILLYNQQNML